MVRIATCEPGTSKTDDVNSKQHGRLVIMCGKGGAGKSYTVDSVLSTLRNEYNFTEDISDFRSKITDKEKEVIKRTMLAIAQIEVNVKTFWADMYKRMPITAVSYTHLTLPTKA